MKIFSNARGPSKRERAPRALGLFLLTASLSLGAVCLADPAWGASQPHAALTKSDAPSRGTSNVSPEVAQRAAAIARQTMSPFCPGRTLSDCPSEYATAWRKDIRAMVAAGMSADEIQKELEGRVGENLSGSPNRNASYGVSLGLALGAALVLFFVLSRLRRNSASGRTSTKDGPKKAEKVGSDTPPPSSLVDDTRLEQEIELVADDE